MSAVNYSNRANYRGVKINQRTSSLLHSFRQKIEEYQRHLDKEKSKLNEYFYFNMETNKLMKTQNPKKRMEEIEKNLNDIKSNFKEESQNSKEDLELKSKLNKQKHNTKNALKGKDLDLEEYEKSGLTPKDYIEKNWTKQYRNKNITNRMKKRTLESLEAYEEMKKTNNIELKETLNKKGMTATLQEIVFKITKNENNEEYTKEELLKILQEVGTREEKKGNIVLGRTLHFDESSNHIHIFISNKNYELLKNQYAYINKKYNQNFKYLEMSKQELKKFGELQQEDDLEIAKMCRPRLDIKRRWELDKNWTNKPKTKEEIEKNQMVLSKYRLKNKRIHLKQNGITIHERDFNNVKFEEEKLQNLKKDIENKIEFNQNLEIKNNEELENISRMSDYELKRRIKKKEIEEVDKQIAAAKKQGGASEMEEIINKKEAKKSEIEIKK